MLTDLKCRLRALFCRKAMESELDDELSFHFEHEVEKLRQTGVTEKEALRQARLRFGGKEQIKEECREARGTSLLESAAQDAHYGLRAMRKMPVSLRWRR